MAFERRKALPQFGKYLKQERERKGMTQQEVADILRPKMKIDKVGLSQSGLAQYETGKINDPDPLILQRLAEVYEVSYFEMVMELVDEKYRIANQEWRSLRTSLEAKKVRERLIFLEEKIKSLREEL